jgi:YYY domain-containing protein
MTEALAWWALLSLVGAAALPLAFVLFPGLPDRGYSLARPLALLLLAYVLWAGATLRAIPNGTATVIVLVVALEALGLLVVARRLPEMLSLLRRHLLYVLASEALFAGSFALALWLRSHVAGIHDIEKPMDFLMLNAVLESRSFPPYDPWMAGERLNYYYFGYVVQAVPVRFLGLPAGVGYNLALASTLALGASAAFGLAYNLVRSAGGQRGWGLSALLTGVLTVYLVFVAGNLEGMLEVLSAHGVGDTATYGWASVRSLDGVRRTEAWYPTAHWWWLAPIVFFSWTEFPFFSYLLGDLHPHVLATPFTFMALGMALSLLLDSERAAAFWRHPQVLLTGLLVGGLGFMNSWHLPPALALTALAVGMGCWRRGLGLLPSLARAAGFGVAVAMVAVGLYSPFFFGSRNPTDLFFSQGPAVRPAHLFLFWGVLLVPVFTLGLVETVRAARRPRGPLALAVAAVGALLPLAAWAIGHRLLSTPTIDLPHRTWGWPTVAILSSLLFLVLAGLAGRLLPGTRATAGPAGTFALALAALGLGMLLVPELVLVRDALGLRVNTVLKLWYQGWLFLGPSCAFALYAGLRGLPRLPLALRPLALAWGGVLAALLLAGLVYPVTASFARTDGFRTHRTVDGLDFLRRGEPHEYEATMWLAAHTDNRDVVLEAAGPGHSEYGRIASRTGVQTVLGWPGHERQWRGVPWELLERRWRDVDVAYCSPDPAVAQALLSRYGVRYVYVGRVERQRYLEQSIPEDQRRALPPECRAGREAVAAGLAKFGQFMDVVFRNQEVVIYRVRGAPP